MTQIKRIICAFLSVCVVATPLCAGVLSVGAEDIGTIQQKLEDLDKQKKEYQAILDKTASDIAEKEKYNEALVNKINVLDEKIILTRDAIAEENKKIKEIQKDIDKADAAVDAQMGALCKRLRAIYMAGSASNLEIILGAKDFSDMLDKMTLVKTLTKYDKELIDKVNAKLDIVNTKKKELEDKKSELEEQENSLNEDIAELNKLLAENRDALSDLELASQQANDKLGIISAEQSSFEEQSRLYFEQQAEQARQRASQSDSRNQSSTTKPAEKKQDNDDNDNNDDDNGYTEPAENNDDDPDDNNNSYYDDDTPPSSLSYVWPTPGCYTLTSVFGEPRSGYGHGAIDIGAPMYSKVVAAADGVVSYSYNGCIHNWGKEGSCGCGGGYGNYVTIDHGNGRMTLYGHLSTVNVSSGESVSAGDVIGYSGSTGWSSGPHLHYETLYYGVKYDPMTEYSY